jgi:hypothetical protein
MPLPLRAFQIYLGAWWAAFGKAGRKRAPLNLKRLAFLVLAFPAFLLLQALHWLAHGIDAILFPKVGAIALRSPLFVVGIPRSGTTFIHRSLATDTETFTTLPLWEAVFAPALCQKYLIRFVGRIDQAIGAPLQKTVNALTRSASGPLEDIHAVGLEAPEEDYLTLLPAAGCFFPAIAFPSENALWPLAQLSEIEPIRREQILSHYRSCLQKHLAFRGTHLRLLSKNAAFATWIPDLRSTFPDARFICCVRTPFRALSSQVSSLQSAAVAFAYDPHAARLAELMEAVFAAGYASLARHLDADCALIDQEDLARDNAASLRALCQLIDLHPEGNLAHELDRLAQAQGPHKSKHHHEDTGNYAHREALRDRLNPPYQQCLAHPLRAKP